jgi:hypothetical protein
MSSVQKFNVQQLFMRSCSVIGCYEIGTRYIALVDEQDQDAGNKYFCSGHFPKTILSKQTDNDRERYDDRPDPA